MVYVMDALAAFFALARRGKERIVAWNQHIAERNQAVAEERAQAAQEAALLKEQKQEEYEKVKAIAAQREHENPKVETDLVTRAMSGSLPFKVTRYDPQTNVYHTLATRKTFGEAYEHMMTRFRPDEATHVVQTHGTNEEIQQLVTGRTTPSSPPSGGSSVARRAGIGYLLAGPMGAAVGAATQGAQKEAPLYKLPHLFITARDS
jgi:hypothetical protein